MGARLSRRKLATFAVDKITSGTPVADALKHVAAHLVDSGRTRESELLIRDIEDILAERGIVVADITSVHPLSGVVKEEIRSLLDAKTLHLREHIDDMVLGGIRVDMPGKRFDGTLRRKLIALKAKQL